MGYHRAGFEVVGVDNKPQKNYPFEFVQIDAFEALEKYGKDFDVIHTSPPCQRYSSATPENRRHLHPDLIARCRKMLKESGKPYIIENVRFAPMKNAVMICGSMFGLEIWRHRYFECDPEIVFPPCACNHGFKPVLITGHSGPRKDGYRRRESTIKEKREAIKIDWMVGSELTQAIPPAYTEWIGKQIINEISNSVP